MSNGIDWFRWHHGSVTDPKFQLVARKAGASLPDVLAVRAFLLEASSAATPRGSYGQIDAEAVDCLFNFPDTETRTASIIAALEGRGMLADGRVVEWEKRQTKRERADDNSTARVAACRARKAAETAVTADETPCNASNVSETPREEKSREEKEKRKRRKNQGQKQRLHALRACPSTGIPRKPIPSSAKPNGPTCDRLWWRVRFSIIGKLSRAPRVARPTGRLPGATGCGTRSCSRHRAHHLARRSTWPPPSAPRTTKRSDDSGLHRAPPPKG